jgi:hypothetical protein
MFVTININSLGENVESLIKKKLKARKLPPCLGSMSPPITRDTIDIEDDVVFKVKGSIPKENIVLTNIKDIVSYKKYDTDITYNKFILDINGRDVIESMKDEAANSYVDHVSSCAICKHVDVCDKLTTHYLRTIKLLEDNNKC